MNGMITTKEYTDFSEPIKRMKEYTVTGVVLKTTTKENIRPYPETVKRLPFWTTAPRETLPVP